MAVITLGARHPHDDGAHLDAKTGPSGAGLRLALACRQRGADAWCFGTTQRGSCPGTCTS